MAPELQDRIREVFPNASDNATFGYGLTECTAVATINCGKSTAEAIVLRPSRASVEIEVRGESGEPVAANVDGNICIRSPLIMLEYWRNPEATAQTLLKGRWLLTETSADSMRMVTS